MPANIIIELHIPELGMLAEAIQRGGKPQAIANPASTAPRTPVNPPMQSVPAQTVRPIASASAPASTAPVAAATAPTSTTPTFSTARPNGYAPAPQAFPGPAPAQPIPAAPTAPTATAPTYSIADLSRAAAQIMDTKQRELQQLLTQFGIAQLTSLPPTQFGAFATALRQLGAKL